VEDVSKELFPTYIKPNMSEAEQEQQVPTHTDEVEKEEEQPVLMGEAVSQEDGPCLIRNAMPRRLTFPPSRAF
jgi:hypothetical protein